MKKLIIVVLAVLSITVLSSCTPKSEENKDVINIGYFPNVSHAPAMVGVENGIYEKELNGIKVSTKNFPNGSLFMDALSTGQIDIGYAGPGPVLNRYLQGQKVVAIAGASRGENVLVVRKDVKFENLKDLKGKIVATPSTGCTHDLILRKMLQEAGMAVVENGGKVKRIPQKPATMIGLFKQKQIHAALVSEPWASVMEAKGVVNVVRDSKEVPWEGKLPAAVLVVREDFLKNNPDTVESFLKANRQAVKFIKDNPDETSEIIIRQIKSITDQQMEEEIIKKSMDRIEYTDKLDQNIMQEFADLSKQLGFVEGNSLLDGLYR